MNLFKRVFLKRTKPAVDREEARRRELQRQIALASVPEDHPLWQAVLEIVDEHERNMVQRVLLEGITSEERHYTAGLAASAEYLANALRDLKAQAVKDQARQKGEE